MKRSWLLDIRRVGWLLLLVLSPLAGCGSPAAAPPALPKAAPADVVETEKADAEKEAKLAKIRERYIAKLPEADAVAVRKQKICPVMEQPLGSMGTPMRVEIKGRIVYLCCDGCLQELMDKPEETLAKIPKP